jgi:cholesterol 7alpha-monooxygenase
MVEAATRSLFGSHLHNLDPDIVENMLSFGDHAWQVIFRLPTFLNLDVTAPRKKLMDALRVFVQLPESQRSEQAWAIKNVLDASDSFDIDFESRASVLLLMYWA